MEELKAAILREVGPVEETELDAEALADVERLAREKYASAEWIYGSSPAYGASAEKRFAGGSVAVRVSVAEGVIVGAGIRGDFFGSGDIRELERALEGLAAGPGLAERLEGLNVERYINGLSTEKFAELIERCV